MILELNSGDTAWVLTSASLVLLMTPGLALFYGGMVRAKSVLNMIMMSFLSIGIVGVLWVLYGYSMSSGTSIGGLIGNPLEYFGLNGIIGTPDDGVPTFAGVAFGSTFAIITVALISGAIADRVKFSTWAVFSIIWATLVYF
ncbi:MAG: ammonia channel protein, partial [Propionicimonas sp.]|nr:ammonia channel protein [Propionicimonas sp.]